MLEDCQAFAQLISLYVQFVSDQGLDNKAKKACRRHVNVIDK